MGHKLKARVSRFLQQLNSNEMRLQILAQDNETLDVLLKAKIKEIENLKREHKNQLVETESRVTKLEAFNIKIQHDFKYADIYQVNVQFQPERICFGLSGPNLSSEIRFICLQLAREVENALLKELHVN